jgi:hypothetical protein
VWLNVVCRRVVVDESPRTTGRHYRVTRPRAALTASATLVRVGLHAVAVGITQFPPTNRFR